MEKARDHLPEHQPKAGPVARDLARLRSDGAASTAELREFLGRIRGRTPQEMLGAVAESRLTRSIFLATFLCLLLLAALTVLPYGLKHRSADASASAAQENVAEEEAVEEGEPARDVQAKGIEEPAQPAAPPGVDAEQAAMDPERAVDALGIGETRVADPNENPVETKLDKLLDGIE